VLVSSKQTGQEVNTENN